jgi:hypothetical protein
VALAAVHVFLDLEIPSSIEQEAVLVFDGHETRQDRSQLALELCQGSFASQYRTMD